MSGWTVHPRAAAILRAAVPVVVVLAGCTLAAACQRRTEALPPAPQFAVVNGRPVPAPQPPRPTPSYDAVLPGTLEDFLRHAGSDTITFAEGSAELSAEARAILDRQAEWLLKYPGVAVSLEGHSDEADTQAHAFAMGEARAEAMRLYLAIRGIAPGRLSVTSYGRARPLAGGFDAETRRRNRRGQTVLIPSGS